MTFTATPSPYRFAPAWIGGGLGLLLALMVMIVPDWRLESLVGQLGLPEILSAAQPPLGLKARVLLAVVAGAGAGAVGWAAAYLLWGPGGLLAGRVAADRPDDEDYVPSVRRSDRHPDAPPRRPLHAAELGAPRHRRSTTRLSSGPCPPIWTSRYRHSTRMRSCRPRANRRVP
ncbi:hypothetical protein P0F65_01800 [Sphingomonas sp. I4]